MERAALAKELLQSRMFKECMAAVKADLVVGLETVAFDDVEKQHDLALSLQILKRLHTKLERWVDDGKMEQKKLDQQNWIDRAKQVWKG